MQNNILPFVLKDEVGKNLISPVYEKLTSLLNDDLPTAMTEMNKQWFLSWLSGAMEKLTLGEYNKVAKVDVTVQEAMILGHPILLRLLNACRYEMYRGERGVIIADCYSGVEHLDYPAPLFIFKYGKGISFFSRYHIFENDLDPEKVIEQTTINSGSKNIKDVLLKEGSTGNPERELILSLIHAYRKDALAAQGGWSLVEKEKGNTVLSFTYPTSNNTVQEWVLTFSNDHFDIIFED